MAVVIAAAGAALAGVSLAGAPETSPRPVARPDAAPAAEAASPAGRSQPPADSADIAENRDGGGLVSSLRPVPRPAAISRAAQQRKEERARGMVCGDPDIQGERVGRVAGRIAGCGIDEAVRVRSIDGIAFSQHALMDCRTAEAIKTWIGAGMKPAVAGYGGGVKQLRVAAHYACRARNNQRGAKISEHGKGRAIDISGFLLRDGRTITLLGDWGRGEKGQILRRMHRSACGPFGTVLGPESDRFHADHFHFDTARYRSGSYCR